MGNYLHRFPRSCRPDFPGGPLLPAIPVCGLNAVDPGPARTSRGPPPVDWSSRSANPRTPSGQRLAAIKLQPTGAKVTGPAVTCASGRTADVGTGRIPDASLPRRAGGTLETSTRFPGWPLVAARGGSELVRGRRPSQAGGPPAERVVTAPATPSRCAGLPRRQRRSGRGSGGSAQPTP